MIVRIIMIFAFIVSVLAISIDGKKHNIPKLHIAMRGFLIALLLLVGLNLKWESKSEKLPVYFAVDQSYSQMANKQDIENQLKAMIDILPNDQSYEIISFGSDSALNIKQSGKLDNIDLSQVNVNEKATNYEQIMNLIGNKLEEDTGANIVLFSDGIENEGDILRTIQDLKLKKADIYWIPYEKVLKRDVQVSGLKGPNRVFEGQNYVLSVEIESNYVTEGLLKTYRNGNLIEMQEVAIPKGKSVLNRRFEARELGQNIIEAVLEVKDDNQLINNSYRKLVQVEGKAQVLLVKNRENDNKNFENILLENDIKVISKIPQNLSLELTSLINYNAIVLEDISLENMNKKFLDNLEIYLEEYGGGLLVSGGENSYALGGYYKTKLEELLPVNMEKKKDNILEQMGLVIVIDQSGSMSGDSLGKSKIEVAKDASAKAINSMMPGDKIGILAFSDSRKWVVPVGDIEDAKEIKRKISTIDSEGGTSIIPALEAAYESIKDVDVQHKHIILVTDGQAEQDGYKEVLKKLSSEKITLTTLGIGQGADYDLLNFLARNAGGRFYKVDNYLNLPEIFTKETAMMADRYLNNRSFYPNVVSTKNFLNDMYKRPIMLEGYVSTTIKPRASLMMESDEEEPILAYWNYGLGKVYAWTSDFDGMWNKNYLNTESGRKFYLELLEDLLKKSTEKLEFDEKSIGLHQKLVVYRSSNEEEYSFKLLDQSGKEYDIETNKSLDGWEIEFEKGDGFIYSLIAKDSKNEVTDYNFVTQYSKEYDWTEQNEDSVDFWLDQLEGEKISSIEDFDYKPFVKKEYEELWKYFLILFLMVFLVDVYIRKTDKQSLYTKDSRVHLNKSNFEDREMDKAVELDIDKLIKNKNKKV